MNYFYSPLEQFLLLKDSPTLIFTIFLSIPIEFDDNLFWWTIYLDAIYEFFLYDVITLNLF